MEISLNDFKLASGGREGPSELSISGTRVVQIAGFMRATSIRALPRKNRTTTVSFAVSKEHKTLQDAEKFCLEHESLVPESGLLTMSAGVGATVVKRYLKNACVTSVEVSHQGVSTVARYEIVGGIFTVSAT